MIESVGSPILVETQDIIRPALPHNSIHFFSHFDFEGFFFTVGGLALEECSGSGEDNSSSF